MHDKVIDFVHRGSEERSAIERVVDWLRDAVARIKRLIGGKKAQNDAALREYGMTVEEMEHGLELLSDALAESRQTVNKRNGVQETETKPKSKRDTKAKRKTAGDDDEYLPFSLREKENTADDGGVMYSLRIKHSDGSIEEIADARSVSDDDVLKYLRLAKSGELYRSTYIPLRNDTPQVLIGTLDAIGVAVENRSLVMQVDKARQAMAEGGW